MPPSIAIATPVLGGPGTMRVVLNSSSILEPPPTNGLCNSRLCVGHASVHCDSGPRAWGPGERARALCVSQQSTSRTHHMLRVLHLNPNSNSDSTQGFLNSFCH